MAAPSTPHSHNLSSNVAGHEYESETTETLETTEEDFLKNISDISDFKYSDYNTKYIDLSDFNLAYFTNVTNKDNIRLEFLKQFYLEVDMYIQTNHELNDNFFDHEFTFNNRYILSISGDNFVKNDKYIPVKYKLKRDTENITIVNMSIINTPDTPDTCQVLPPVTISESAKAANLSFNKLIELAPGDVTDNSIYTNIDIYYKDLEEHHVDDWKRNRFAFVEYFYKNIIVQNGIYGDILTWLADIRQFATFKDKLTIKFNKVLNDHLTVFRYIDNYITNNISANDTHNSTSKFKDIIDKTIELKNINNNLNDKTKNIKNMNIKVEKQQKNLSKINIVLIFAIIIFIFLVICLVLHNYINNKTIYILSGIILLFALIIYIYIYNLKTTAYYIAENFTESSNSIITIEAKIDELGSLRNSIKTNAKNLKHSYYNVINPLLNIELKKFREKNDNTKLYDKIASFNVNIGQGDIKFSIETIQYLITISILFVLILLLIKITNRYYYYLIIMISFVIFIILTLIYFVKIVRVVRTKSNNYYLDKPKSQKK